MSRIVILGVLLVFVLIKGASADEGMWTFNNLPTKYLKTHYNFDATPEWADHIMKSSVRFNSGGSASFISSTGLVITNHHVGADMLAKISTPQHNYYDEGFYAKDLSQEVKSPDLELNQLISIEDVTNRVNAVVKPGMDSGKAFEARRAVIADIKTESFKKTGLRSDVITLYNGGLYQLYRFKKYTDVRLVFAPEFKAAFFGGDPDNFEYPRYDLDICIFRVYENGKPAKIDNFLGWSSTGTKENDLVFVSGNPGNTSRMFTIDAMKFARDVRLPFVMERLYRTEVALQQYMGRSDESGRRGQEDFFGVQNSRKGNLGRLQGLQDPKFFKDKEAEEKTLKERIAKDPRLSKDLVAWKNIANAQKDFDKIIFEYFLVEKGWGLNSRLFGIARTLVRMAEEDRRPNNKRLEEFRDSDRESLKQTLFSTAPIYNDLEIAEFGDSLSFFQAKLGGDNPLFQQILDGKSVVERPAQLVVNSKLADVNVRKQLAEGGRKAIISSQDPMIKLALLVDPAARAVRKKYEDKVDSVSQQAYGQIANAKFALDGTNDYPDATFSLRLAFGPVKGYEQGGIHIPAMTTMGGAFEREKEHGAKDPFKLPDDWHKHRDDIDLNAPFNFVSTADIIGGNSGSPVINTAGEFVGIIFDGNLQSLPLQFGYSDIQARAVSVNSNAIVEAMKKVYGATALANEIGH
jgi:hypothetical protein